MVDGEFEGGGCGGGVEGDAAGGAEAEGLGEEGDLRGGEATVIELDAGVVWGVGIAEAVEGGGGWGVVGDLGVEEEGESSGGVGAIGARGGADFLPVEGAGEERDGEDGQQAEALGEVAEGAAVVVVESEVGGEAGVAGVEGEGQGAVVGEASGGLILSAAEAGDAEVAGALGFGEVAVVGMVRWVWKAAFAMVLRAAGVREVAGR